MYDNICFLLVTCCLEKTRSDLLKKVVDNLLSEFPEAVSRVCVFDNASTQDVSCLTKFSNYYKCETNVGYWSAIDWWLRSGLADKRYSYIIESDLIHHDFFMLNNCSDLLDHRDDIGAVRVHEYSVENKHLYDKDNPVKGSKKNAWRSHTNKVTNEKVTLTQIKDKLFESNFLTHLPALNRTSCLLDCFDKLKNKDFCELDFQKLYHDHYQKIAVLDGGIFVDNAGFESGLITGSWTSQSTLDKIGYKNTRFTRLVDTSEIKVQKLH